VLFHPALAAEVERRRKRAGHLWSKQRFVSAQLLAGLEGGVWLRLAAQANQAAGRLAEGFARLPGVRMIQPVQANEVFAAFPPGLFAALTDAGFGFHEWPAPPGVAGDVVRLVTSYATTGADVQALLDAAARYA
jgi:threonine aldolase